MDLEDPTNIIGISSLVNKSHIDEKKDLVQIEKSIIGSSSLRTLPERDPAEEFKKTIKELSADTGIDLGGSNSPPRSRSHSRSDSRSDSTSRSRSSSRSSHSHSKSRSRSRSHSRSRSETPRSASPASSRGHHHSHHDERHHRSHYYRRHEHHDKNSYLDDVLKNYSNYSKKITAEEDNEEELKIILLEDIDELKQELEADGSQLARIPEVNRDSKMIDIKEIHKILRLKYDRKRCTTLGTELILAGAKSLEWVFDGKRSFGIYKPDLTDWSNTLRAKLRRLKYESSTIVSDAMQSLSFGPASRLALELIPSAILYSNMRKNAYGKTNYSPEQMSEAFEDLRQFEN
jgi:hypothetical protein